MEHLLCLGLSCSLILPPGDEHNKTDLQQNLMNSKYHLHLNHSEPMLAFDQIHKLVTDINSSNKYSQL